MKFRHLLASALALLLALTVFGSAALAEWSHVHNWVKVEEDPATCTEAGVIVERCTRCQDYRDRTIPALGHSFPADGWKTVIEPTCTEVGREMNTCSRVFNGVPCGYEWWRDIPAKGHTWSDWAPDADTAGMETRTCSVCGETEKREYESSADNSGKLTISAAVAEPKAAYLEGDTVKFSCTLRNETGAKVQPSALWTEINDTTDELKTDLGGYLEPDQAREFTMEHTISAQEAKSAFNSLSGLTVLFHADAAAENGAVLNAEDAVITLPMAVLELTAWSIDWDEDSAEITCEVTNRSGVTVTLLYNGCKVDDGTSYDSFDALDSIILPNKTYTYKFTCPITWDPESWEPRFINVNTVGTTEDGVYVYSNDVDVEAGYEIGDMELVAELTETSEPENGMFYRKGETIEYLIHVSNCQRYPIYAVKAGLAADEENPGAALYSTDRFPGSGAKDVKAYHVVDQKDCEQGLCEMLAYGQWYSGKEDMDDDINIIFSLAVQSPCGTENDLLLIDKVVINEPSNPEGFAEGETITYQITVTNKLGRLRDVQLRDPLFFGEMDDNLLYEIGDMDLDDEYTGTFDYEVTYDDVLTGYVINRAYCTFMNDDTQKEGSAHSQYVKTPTVAGVPLDTKGALRIELSETSVPPKGWDCYEEGDYISYRLTISNNSTEDLKNLALYNSHGVGESFASVPQLGAGETCSVTFDYAVPYEEIEASNHLYMLVWMTFDDASGKPHTEYSNVIVSPIGSVRYRDYAEDPELWLDSDLLSAPSQGDAYRPGEKIRKMYYITNPTPYTVKIDSILVYEYNDSENHTLDLTDLADALAPGESTALPFEHEVTEADARCGKARFVFTVKAAFRMPDGSKLDAAPSLSSTYQCKLTAASIRPGIEGQMTEPAVTQFVTSKPRDGSAYTAGETVEIDVYVYAGSSLRYGSPECFCTLSDADGHKLGMGMIVRKGLWKYHISYEVKPADTLLGEIDSLAWATLKNRSTGKEITVYSTELTIPTKLTKVSGGFRPAKPGRWKLVEIPGLDRYFIELNPWHGEAYQSWLELVGKAQSKGELIQASLVGEDILLGALDREYDLLLETSDEKLKPVLETERALYTDYLDAYRQRLSREAEQDAVSGVLAWELIDKASELYTAGAGVRNDLGSAGAVTVAPAENCLRAFEAVGDSAYLKSLSACAEHTALIVCENRLKAEIKSDPSCAETVWNEIEQLWLDALDEEYERLMEGAGADEYNLLAAERAAFLKAYGAERAFYLRCYPEDIAAASELSVRILREKVLSLCE